MRSRRRPRRRPARTRASSSAPPSARWARWSRRAGPEGSLDSSRADSKPFWEAIKQTNEALGKAETALRLKDDTFFSALAQAGAGTRQALIALEMNNVGSGAVLEATRKLDEIVTSLTRNYGREAARLAKGGELSAAEKAQLAALREQQGKLDARLAEVEKKAGQNDAKIRRGAEEIRRNSRRIRDSKDTVGDFVASLLAVHLVSSLIWGWHWWWGPWGWWGPDFVYINIDIWYDAIPFDDYDWDLVEAEMDIADLELAEVELAEIELADTEFGDDVAWLEGGDFSLDDGDLTEITSELEPGWAEVDTDAGQAVMDSYEDNFDEPAFVPEPAIDTYEGGDFGDFGGDFDDFGGGFDDLGF